MQVGVHRIKRIRKKLNLRCETETQVQEHHADSKHNLPIAPNLLERNFQMSAPNQAWVSDLTYIWTDEGWLYLAGIKDLFNGELVGYAMSERTTRTLVMQALFEYPAALKRPGHGLILHSGPRRSVLLAGLSGSCEAVRHENVHEPQGRLLGQRPDGKLLGFPEKNELVHHMRFATRQEARNAITEYIEIFYNRRRKRARLGYLSPAAFTQQFFKNQLAA